MHNAFKIVCKITQCLHRHEQSSVHHYSSQVTQKINSNYHVSQFLMMPLWFCLQLYTKGLQSAASVSVFQMIITSLIACSEGCFWKDLLKETFIMKWNSVVWFFYYTMSFSKWLLSPCIHKMRSLINAGLCSTEYLERDRLDKRGSFSTPETIVLLEGLRLGKLHISSTTNLLMNRGKLCTKFILSRIHKDECR